MDFRYKTILSLLLFLTFSCEDNSVEPLVCGEGLTNVDGVCQLCGEGLTEVDGKCNYLCEEGVTECYYQGDIDVLQDIIDVNESLSGEEPLEMGSHDWMGGESIVWVDGRIEELFLDYDHQTNQKNGRWADAPTAGYSSDPR